VMGDFGVESEEYIELTFPTINPKPILNGTVIMVKGTYRPFPGGFCMLPSSILVNEVFDMDTATGDVVAGETQF